MEENKYNIKCLPFLKRFVKNQGKYNQFVTWIKFNIKHRIEFTTIKDFVNNFESLTKLYSYFASQNDCINDFSKHLTETIGQGNAFKQFQDFIIENYGQITYDDFIKNVNVDFLNQQTNRFGYSFEQPNEIKKLPITAYLFYGFEWAATPQQHEFWASINDEWVKKCETIALNKIYKQ